MKRAALGAAVLFSALLLPGLARAEAVPGSVGAQDSILAVAPDGTPRVAFVAVDGSIVLAVRSADGVWSEQTIPLGGAGTALVALAVGPSGSILLVEATSGAWLKLAEQGPTGWRIRTIAVAPKTGLLGFGGLALDRSGRPLVAYASLVRSRKSSLRLVHETASGALVGEAITKGGFPKSDQLPTVTPVVLPSGAVRVVEVYSGAAIEWSRKRGGKGWAGRFLYANNLGEPAGPARAVSASAGGVWSTWTELFPSYNESHVVLALHRDGEHVQELHTHAFVVALALSGANPEVAADDYVDLEGARTVYAGLVLDGSASPLELAGNLEGYAVDGSGARQYLLLDAGGLGWYRAAVAPTPRLSVSATVDGASFALSGRLGGAAGDVELWRETKAGAELVTTLPVGADGAFSYVDLPPLRPLTYRVIYRDPASGLPVAALVRDVLGA